MKLSTSYRRNALLKELIQANVPLSLTQLAQKLGVKERMIRYDIADVAQSRCTKDHSTCVFIDHEDAGETKIEDVKTLEALIEKLKF